jgi:hypothetical protein
MFRNTKQVLGSFATKINSWVLGGTSLAHKLLMNTFVIPSSFVHWYYYRYVAIVLVYHNTLQLWPANLCTSAISTLHMTTSTVQLCKLVVHVTLKHCTINFFFKFGVWPH